MPKGLRRGRLRASMVLAAVSLSCPLDTLMVPGVEGLEFSERGTGGWRVWIFEAPVAFAEWGADGIRSASVLFSAAVARVANPYSNGESGRMVTAAAAFWVSGRLAGGLDGGAISRFEMGRGGAVSGGGGCSGGGGSGGGGGGGGGMGPRLCRFGFGFVEKEIS